MKTNTKAFLVGIGTSLWIALIAWAFGCDFRKPGEGLGAVFLFAPFLGLMAALIYHRED